MYEFKKNEIIVTAHRQLNVREPNFDALETRINSLSEYSNGRKPVLALEGDVFEHKGEIYFAHFNHTQNFSLDVFNKLVDDGIASHPKDALKYIASKNKETLLKIELKKGITRNGIEKLTSLLKENDLNNYMYDSFFAKELDIAHDTDEGCITSHHLLFFFHGLQVPYMHMPKHKPTLKTIPYINSKGNPKMLMMYGAVNSIEKFQDAARHENVVGISDHLDEPTRRDVYKKSMAH